MITAIAIDDEPQAIEVIKMHASKVEGLNLVGSFHNPITALDFLRNNPVDLIFLDINMPEISGMELLKQLRVKPYVIFTTAYESHAVESYQFEALGYLLKPFDFDSFRIAFNRVEKAVKNSLQNNDSEAFIFIKDGSKIIKVLYNDILLLKGCGNYLEFVTTKGSHTTRITFSELLGKLPKNQFVRIHNSSAINIKKIEKIENNHVTLGTHKVSIGETYKSSFLKIIEDNLI